MGRRLIVVAGVGQLALAGAWVPIGCGGAESARPSAEGPSVKPKQAAKPPPPVAPPKATPVARTPKVAEDLAAAQDRAQKIYAQHRESFFCHCAFSEDGRTLPRSCGYRTRADEGRARVIDWVHVVPPRLFGEHRSCWGPTACPDAEGQGQGGIECCRQTDPTFSAMERDLFNLVPAIEEVALDRAHFDFAELEGEPRLYGSCDFEVDASKEQVEPPEEVRGDIARIYLYMDQAWPGQLKLAPQQRSLLVQWNELDPPDDWERARAMTITAQQGVGDSRQAAAAGGEAKR